MITTEEGREGRKRTIIDSMETMMMKCCYNDNNRLNLSRNKRLWFFLIAFTHQNNYGILSVSGFHTTSIISPRITRLLSGKIVSIDATSKENEISLSQHQEDEEEEESILQQEKEENISSSSGRRPRHFGRKKKKIPHHNDTNINYIPNNINNVTDDGSDEYSFWEKRLSIKAFNMDLHNLAMENAEKAQDALEIMEQMYEPGNPSVVLPDSASYTTVIEGWCFGNQYPNAAQQVDALLQKMINTDYLQPNELSYALVCQQWADLYKDDKTGANIERAHAILNDIKARGEIPNVKVYTIVLEGWCRRVGKLPHAMDRALEILREMENGAGAMTTRPNVLTYTSIIGGLARCNQRRDMAVQADEILERMKRNGVEPDMVAYTSVLNCWAKTKNFSEKKRSAERALQILRDLEELYLKEENYHLKPSVITYATAIKAIGNSLDPESPRMAEEVLRRMYDLTESGKINVPPNTGTYNSVISNLSKGSKYAPRQKKLAAARRAEHLLVEMIKRFRDGEVAVEPNKRTWGAVLSAWAESGLPECGEQAQRVLDLYDKWYTEGKTNVQPNVVCYTTVMNAWSRGNAPPEVALENIEKLLKTMETRYEETRDIEIRPNKISYVVAIDAYSRKCDDKIGQRAQATVDRMVRLYSLGIGYDRPTRIVFNALINAWSKSSEPDAAQKAEKIFRWMESQYRAGDDCVQPDEMSLAGVLNAWANNPQDGGALRAQEILDHTESLTLEERGFAHSIVSYNILIKAWGRSRAPDSIQRVEQILLKLEKEYNENKYNARPDITTYSSVINCCAYYSGADDEGRTYALDVALRTFDKIRKVGEIPNSITYGTLFKAIGKLASPFGTSRDDMIQKYFERCCEEGQVDTFVLSQVRSASLPIFRNVVLEPWEIPDSGLTDIKAVHRAMPRKYGRNVTT